jgi:two-component sensor histidine kinase/PAS domain-containing protein
MSGLYFLQADGEMSARMREYDWGSSPLGPPEHWPQPLRTATAMLLNTLQPMFIAWGPELTFLYNDGYAPLLGARHPAALGASCMAVWADVWDELGPIVERSVAGGRTWREDMLFVSRRKGYPEETYFTFANSPLLGDDGKVAGIFSTAIETTDRVLANRRVQETTKALATSEERYRRQGEHLFTLFEKAPGLVAVLEGPQLIVTLMNASYRQMIGDRDVLGLPYRKARPELEGTGAFERLDHVYATGRPYVGTAIRATIAPTGGRREERHLDFVFQPIQDEAGRVTGIFIQGNDVTERTLFAQKQTLLLNELNHRVKNNLTTVQSIAVHTAREASDVGRFMDDFVGRLIALARTNDALTKNAWSGADVQDLLQRELGDTFPGRIQLEGPPLRVNAIEAQALGMIIHELATNAAKYGALSTPAGSVLVSWRVEAPSRFTLEWEETGGPRVEPPTRQGFGSRLIARLTKGDLRGDLETNYRPEGLQVRISAPTQWS